MTAVVVPPPRAAQPQVDIAATGRPVTGRSGFPLPLPTRRLAALFAVTAPVVLLGEVSPMFPWIAASSWIALTVTALWDWLVLPPPAAFSAVRANRPVLSLGSDERLEVEVRLAAERDRSVGVRVADEIHPGIVRSADPAPQQVRGDRSAWFATGVRPMKRGRHRLGRVEARVRSRLGLLERELVFDLACDVKVFPGVAGIAGAVRLLRRGLKQESGLRHARRRGAGTSFESLREHAPGEDIRRVDWKATAKRGKLISRLYEVERSQNVVLLIDCGRWMTGKVEGLSRLDHVLNSALLLAHVAARRDDRVGALAFSDDILAFVPPSKGRGAVERIMESVFDLEPRSVESDYAKAFRYLASKHRKRSLVILFTDVLGGDASRVVVQEAARSARRHVPLIVTLRDTELDEIALGTPSDASAAYRQAAAEELLLEREQSLAVMRAAGAHVLDCPTGRLSAALVDRYLEVKSRMLI